MPVCHAPGRLCVRFGACWRGAEGAVRPFEGRFGFLNKFGATVNPLAVLRAEPDGRSAWAASAKWF